MAALQDTRTPPGTHVSRSTIHTEQDIGKLLGLMSEPLASLAPARRGFLRGLALLPLVGGGIALFGQPSAVAAPVTADLLEAYKTFLHYELRYLAWEMAGDPACLARYGLGASDDDRIAWSRTIKDITFGEYDRGISERSDPSTRAALVLSAVGHDWREARR